MVTDSVKFLVDAMVRQDEEFKTLRSTTLTGKADNEGEEDTISLRLHESSLPREKEAVSCLC